jgi:hypothetical protein
MLDGLGRSAGAAVYSLTRVTSLAARPVMNTRPAMVAVQPTLAINSDTDVCVRQRRRVGSRPTATHADTQRGEIDAPRFPRASSRTRVRVACISSDVWCRVTDVASSQLIDARGAAGGSGARFPGVRSPEVAARYAGADGRTTTRAGRLASSLRPVYTDWLNTDADSW